MSKYDVKKESRVFGSMIIELYKYLQFRKEYVLSKQVLRSGTSVWVNVTEAQYWFSKKDFLYKNSIALKEIAETEYRFNLLEDWWYIEWYTNRVSINLKLKELIKVLISIVKTTRESLKKW